jgi:hypothetical protein
MPPIGLTTVSVSALVFYACIGTGLPGRALRYAPITVIRDTESEAWVTTVGPPMLILMATVRVPTRSRRLSARNGRRWTAHRLTVHSYSSTALSLRHDPVGIGPLAQA